MISRGESFILSYLASRLLFCISQRLFLTALLAILANQPNFKKIHLGVDRDLII